MRHSKFFVWTSLLNIFKRSLFSAPFILLFFACSDPISPDPDPVDTTGPTIELVIPQTGQTVPIDYFCLGVFSEKINPASVTQESFYIADSASGQKVSGQIVVVNDTTKFIPAQPSVYEHTYVMVFTEGIRDLAGNRLKMCDLCRTYFRTEKKPTEPDVTAPTILSTVPENGATDVANNTEIKVNFSETVQGVNASTFLVEADGSSVSGTVFYSGMQGRFVTGSYFPSGSVVTVTLTDGITDLAGNKLVSYSFSFTIQVGDTTAPQIVTVDPAAYATNVPQNANLSVQFSELVLNVNASTFLVMADNNPVSGTVTFNSQTLTAEFNPSQAFDWEAEVSATLTEGITDAAGNSLREYNWKYYIESEPFTPGELPAGYEQCAVIALHNVVYISGNNTNGTLHPFVAKFDATGKRLWLKDLQVSGKHGVSVEAADDQYLYALCTDYTDPLNLHPYVLQLNADSGNVVASQQISGNDHGKDMILYDGYLYGAVTEQLFKMSASDLSIVQIASGTDIYDGSFIIRAIKVDAHGVFISGGSDQGTLVAGFDHDLNRQWIDHYTVANANTGHGFVVIADNALYVPSSVSSPNYSQPWRVLMLKYGFDGSLLQDSVYTELTSGNGALPTYMACSDGQHIYMLSGPVAFAGFNLIWSNFNPNVNTNRTGIACSGGILYVTNSTNYLELYSATTGAQL